MLFRNMYVLKENIGQSTYLPTYLHIYRPIHPFILSIRAIYLSIGYYPHSPDADPDMASLSYQYDAPILSAVKTTTCWVSTSKKKRTLMMSTWLIWAKLINRTTKLSRFCLRRTLDNRAKRLTFRGARHVLLGLHPWLVNIWGTHKHPMHPSILWYQ